MLYPEFDFFIDLLNGESKVLKWNAIDVVANLASVDINKRFEEIFEKFYSLLHEGSLITAAHVVGNSVAIVTAQPNLESKITSELLKVEKLELPTDECRNVLLCHTILSFDKYFDKIQNRGEVISLVRRQLRNPRNATKAKAREFLEKHHALGDTN
jgi:ERCC4-related helicase